MKITFLTKKSVVTILLISLSKVLSFHTPGYPQEIFINEFLASNSSTNRDPDYHTYADWIEIYNASDESIRLGGFFLTDNLNDATKWRIPDGILMAPTSFIIFWADGKDTGYHTNFKLNSQGEEIGLFAPDKTLIDSVIFDSQVTDISYGRQPDGKSNWYSFENPTPGTINHSTIYLKAKAPRFSLPAGYYTESQVLTLAVDDSLATIRYTLDCSEPTISSPIYETPLMIKSRQGESNYFSTIRTNRDPHDWLPDWVPPSGEVFKGMVLRARVFREGYLPSDIVTKTYFMDPAIQQRYSTLPVISLVSDYKHLFDNNTGIYVPGIYHQNGNNESGNYFQNWEKPIHIEFFEADGHLAFAQNAGVRIQGGSSPASPQKGLHIIARSEYGNNRIEYPIFKNSQSKAQNLKEYKRFIIRAWGSVVTAAKFNDAFAHRLYEQGDLDLQAYRPAVVFINGEYWGLHELREANKNSWYYQYHYGIDRDDPGFDLLMHTGSGTRPRPIADEGDGIHWNKMIHYLNTHSMKIPDNYEYIKTQMDVNNFIAYLGHCTIVGKWDWPNNNEASWRPKTSDGKWKWIQFDMETGFGVAAGLGPQFEMLGPQYNMIKHLIEGIQIPFFGQYGPHPLLIKLIENDEFKKKYIQWHHDKLENEFSPETMNAILDEMVVELEPYMPEHIRRWPYEAESMAAWYAQIEIIRNFLNRRPDYVRQHLLEQFGTDTVPQTDGQMPLTYSLSQNYPNPFNQRTHIQLSLSNSTQAVLTIYDTKGHLIRTMLQTILPAGSHHFVWNGFDNCGNVVASGIYFYRIELHQNEKVIQESKKMILLK